MNFSILNLENNFSGTLNLYKNRISFQIYFKDLPVVTTSDWRSFFTFFFPPKVYNRLKKPN